MTLARFLTKERLTFVVQGKPISTAPRSKRGQVNRGSFKKKEYAMFTRFVAKEAMKEQGFSFADKNTPLYVVIVMRMVKRGKNISSRKKRLAAEADELTLERPYNVNFVTAMLRALQGVVYASQRQIVAVLSVKRYAMDFSVEFTFGKPKSFRVMAHDIRNS